MLEDRQEGPVSTVCRKTFTKPLWTVILADWTAAHEPKMRPNVVSVRESPRR